MPIGNIIGGIIQGASSIIGQGMANDANENLAADQRNWNTDQWNKQNALNQRNWERDNQYNQEQLTDQRAYELEMWEKTNKYNSPQEQMARMAAAGLNPHLMYGKGTVGTAGTAGGGQQQRAANQPTPSVQGYSRAESRNVLQGITAFSDIARLKNLNAQTDNVEQSTENAREDKYLKIQQQNLNLIGIDTSKLQNKKAHALYDYSLETASIATQQARENLIQSLNKGNIQMQTMDTQIKTAKADLQLKLQQAKGESLRNVLNQWEADLNKNNMTKSTPFLLKVGADVIKSFKFSPRNKKIVKSWFIGKTNPAY